MARKPPVRVGVFSGYDPRPWVMKESADGDIAILERFIASLERAGSCEVVYPGSAAHSLEDFTAAARRGGFCVDGREGDAYRDGSLGGWLKRPFDGRSGVVAEESGGHREADHASPRQMRARERRGAHRLFDLLAALEAGPNP